MRVPVIEDDEELAETVAAGLREALVAVDVALELLLAAQGRVVSAEELLVRVREDAADPFARPGCRI
jgi:DNA-binding response OmpR family regulator